MRLTARRVLDAKPRRPLGEATERPRRRRRPCARTSEVERAARTTRRASWTCRRSSEALADAAVSETGVSAVGALADVAVDVLPASSEGIRSCRAMTPRPRTIRPPRAPSPVRSRRASVIAASAIGGRVDDDLVERARVAPARAPARRPRCPGAAAGVVGRHGDPSVVEPQGDEHVVDVGDRAPHRREKLVGADRGPVAGPTPARPSRRPSARSPPGAVISEPPRSRLSTTTSTSLSAARMRLRSGKRNGSGGVPGGHSDSRTPGRRPRPTARRWRAGTACPDRCRRPPTGGRAVGPQQRPRWAAPSMPLASPDTTTTPAAASSRPSSARSHARRRVALRVPTMPTRRASSAARSPRTNSTPAVGVVEHGRIALVGATRDDRAWRGSARPTRRDPALAEARHAARRWSA